MAVSLPSGMPFPRVTAVEVQAPYGLRLSFADGSHGVVDGARWLHQDPPALSSQLRDPAVFATARLDPELETIAWANGFDVCPDVLYALAHGIPLPGVE